MGEEDNDGVGMMKIRKPQQQEKKKEKVASTIEMMMMMMTITRIICRTWLGTVRMQYHWIYNSYSTSSNRERREKCSGIVIIHMVPMGQNIIRRTRHSILI